MLIKKILAVVLITIAVFLAIWGSGKAVSKLPGNTLKYANWTASIIAVLSGFYTFISGSGGKAVYYIFLGSIVVYFLTISYPTEEKGAGK